MTKVTLIESDANARFKHWKKLCEPRGVRREGATLLEGIHLFLTLFERFDAGETPDVRAVVRSSGATQEAAQLAERLAERTGAPLFELAQKLYDEISPVENGAGCLCELGIPAADDLSEALDGDVLYLDGVQDAGNAGTLIRTAAAAGFSVVAASKGTAALWAPKVLRAGMGAHLSVRILENVSPEQLREHFSGVILAADARGGENLFLSHDYEDGRACWVMGAEGPGVSEAALAVADKRFFIPIEPGVESLNVGAAAAVCLFDTKRRRES